MHKVKNIELTFMYINEFLLYQNKNNIFTTILFILFILRYPYQRKVNLSRLTPIPCLF